MSPTQGILHEIRSDPGGASALLECPRAIQPAPGRFLLAASPDPAETLSIPLFPASLPGAILALAQSLPPAWLPGTRLSLRGPFGRGFELPRGCGRIALAAFQAPPALLFPLAAQALAQGADVAFYSHQSPVGLPADVEILPPDLLAEAFTWCDALAAALPLTALPAFRRACNLPLHARFPCPSQALILVPMPCGAAAECGLCGVPTPRGWKMACRDGPVFDLNTLELS
jgi:dihydroorotate dehydrogenase electron transfer subunit